MSTQRNLYAELKAVAAQPDVADTLLEEVAKVADKTGADERGELHTLLHVIQESPILCAKALLTWLADPPREDAASALLSSVSVAYFEADAPADIVFPSTTPSAAVLAGCRMNARYMAPAYALGWVLCLLRQWPDDATAISGANKLLHYLTSEFPDTLHELFKKLQLETFAPQPFEMLSHYKTQIDEERCMRDSYPLLKEFAMSPEERDVVRIQQRRLQREIMRGAEKNSIFMQFMKHRKFKYARTVSFGTARQSGEGEAIIVMKEYSVKTELPQSEWLNPMEGARVRNNLWKGLSE
ncbi:MAG: hypothetical protein HY273_14670 [Gammaproteobacteria bacterium]|nr:hypothetical protein [Gammaproteobacteria bacterium]